MANKKKARAGVEWVGGVIAMPAYVTSESEPYRPELLLWMGADGLVLGMSVGKPGEAIGAASAHLRSTIVRPMVGRPHAPTRLRVASVDLADAVRAAHPTIEVVCAPTPEIDAVSTSMRDKMVAEDAEADPSYLSPGIDAAAMASFFRATAGLFRANPWRVVPSNDSLIAVTIEELAVRDAAMYVVGEIGDVPGIILFESLDGFEAFLEASRARERGEDAAVPPHMGLRFESGADLPSAMRKEITRHRWEVASAAAYPWVLAVDEDRVARQPTARELLVVEALSLAVPKLFADERAVGSAWSGGSEHACTLSVRTHVGQITVSLRARPLRVRQQRPPHEVLADMFELERDQVLDDDRRRALKDELMGEFARSPEARTLTTVRSCELLMDFADEYLGKTIATLRPVELREIVFDILPRKVSVDASEARAIIEEIRAFYAFLKRTSALAQTDACLRVLGGDAAQKLEAALSDPGKFGIAKSFVMAGVEAGFDMDSKEGLEAWMRTMQSKALPPSVGLPPLGGLARPADSAATRAKKCQRKAVRKARKKSR